MRLIKRWVAVCLLGFLASGSAWASDDLKVSWKRFTDELQQVGERMQSRLPERLRENLQVQQESGRLILEVLGADEAHPTFLPSLGAIIHIFQPNADTIYLNANVFDQGGLPAKRTRGTVRISKIAQFRSLSGEVAFEEGPSSLQALSHNDFSSLGIDDRGRFDVILSRRTAFHPRSR